MDGDGRRDSQYGGTYQNPLSGSPSLGQPSRPTAQDRYPQIFSTPSRSDIARTSLPRTYQPQYGTYNYNDQNFAPQQIHSSSPMQGVEMSYSPYAQDSSRMHNIQASASNTNYAAYSPNAMPPPMQHPSMYANVQPYDQRQTAIEVMTNQFSMPTYAQHNVHEASNTSMNQGSSQYLTSQAEQSMYPRSLQTDRVLKPAFGSNESEYHTASAAPPQKQEQSDIRQRELANEYRLYETDLRATFNLIIADRLIEASEKLSVATRWLLSSVVALGFHLDDEAKYEQRLEMWREFNHCWEALGQKQKAMTEDVIRTRHVYPHMLTSEMIIALIDELISLCDQLEAKGLIDYEMGVWEEQIVGIFGICLDLLGSL